MKLRIVNRDGKYWVEEKVFWGWEETGYDDGPFVGTLKDAEEFVSKYIAAKQPKVSGVVVKEYSF